MANINATQLLGLLSFGLTAAASLLAAARRRTGGRFWLTISLINCACFIEIILGYRHRVHDIANFFLQASNLYGDRKPLQDALIFVVLVATTVIILTTQIRRLTTKHRKTAAISTIVVLAVFAMEAISLHAVDAILYRPAGPILLVAWIWTALCVVTIIACWLDHYST